MAAPVSTKLIEAENGELFVVIGNPSEGYTTLRCTGVAMVGNFRRSWQAVSAVEDDIRRHVAPKAWKVVA